MRLSFTHKGDFAKTERFLKNAERMPIENVLQKYGEMGVKALASATPKDSGNTAESWYYTIEKKRQVFTITWANSNVNDGVPIAVILQTGHGTRNGGYVQGRDYINPALKPIFEQLADKAFEEVIKL